MDKVAIGIALGFLAGVLAGLFGVGGGVLFVPALSLALGLDQLTAQATSLLAMLPVVAVGTWRQQKYGHVRLRPALWLGIGGIVGVTAGGFLAISLARARARARVRQCCCSASPHSSRSERCGLEQPQ